jgi:transcription elongation factor Elf1
MPTLWGDVDAMIFWKYLVLQCPSCGQIQQGHTKDPANYSFKCRFCGKSRQVRSHKRSGWDIKVFLVTRDAKEARLKCTELRTEWGKKHDEI